MHHPEADAPLFNSIPPVVVALALVIGLSETVLQLGQAGLVGGPGAVGWRIEAAERFGFYNAAAQYMWETKQFHVEQIWRFVTYPFLHHGVEDALFSAVLVLAIGKFVGERSHWAALLATFFGSAAFCALVAALVFGPQTLVIGAWAPVCGLIGALSWLLWLQGQASGQAPLRAFALIGGLGAIQLIFWLLFGGMGLFEWATGFVGGFAIFAVLQPALGQGPGYWKARLRER